MKTAAVLMIAITILVGVQLGDRLETGVKAHVATIDALSQLNY